MGNDGAGNQMTANRGEVGPWEKFYPVNIPGQQWQVALKAWNGKYVVCHEGKTMQANRAKIGPWEKFNVYATNDCKGFTMGEGTACVAFYNPAFKKWVVAENNKNLMCNRAKAGPWEKFRGWK